MTDKEIATALKEIVYRTSFYGEDHVRLHIVVSWLTEIEEGKAVIVDAVPKAVESKG